jgi:hypothetical protein
MTDRELADVLELQRRNLVVDIVAPPQRPDGPEAWLVSKLE